MKFSVAITFLVVAVVTAEEGRDKRSLVAAPLAAYYAAPYASYYSTGSYVTAASPVLPAVTASYVAAPSPYVASASRIVGAPGFVSRYYTASPYAAYVSPYAYFYR